MQDSAETAGSRTRKSITQVLIGFEQQGKEWFAVTLFTILVLLETLETFLPENSNQSQEHQSGYSMNDIGKVSKRQLNIFRIYLKLIEIVQF